MRAVWPTGALEVLQLDAGIDAVACLEEGVDDDSREPADPRADESVFEVFSAPDHEHDGGHEQASEEEEDADGIEHPGDLTEVLGESARRSEKSDGVLE